MRIHSRASHSARTGTVRRCSAAATKSSSLRWGWSVAPIAKRSSTRWPIWSSSDRSIGRLLQALSSAQPQHLSKRCPKQGQPPRHLHKTFPPPGPIHHALRAHMRRAPQRLATLLSDPQATGPPEPTASRQARPALVLASMPRWMPTHTTTPSPYQPMIFCPRGSVQRLRYATSSDTVVARYCRSRLSALA